LDKADKIDKADKNGEINVFCSMVINFELVEAATPKALNFDNPLQAKRSSG